MQGMCDACGKPSGGNRYCRDCELRMDGIGPSTDEARAEAAAEREQGFLGVVGGIVTILSVVVMLWLMWPSREPGTKKQSERPQSQLMKAMDMRGQIVPALQDDYCLPYQQSVAKVLSQVDDEEAARTAIREARSAGWPRTVVVRRGDKLKVLEVDVTFSSGVIVRVRPVKHQWLDAGCWIRGSVVSAKEPFVD